MRLVWLLVMGVEMVCAIRSAYSQNVSETILFCTAAILCALLMRKDGDSNAAD